MADPFTWIAAIGLVLGAYGTVQQGKAADDQAQFAAAVANRDAKLSEANAEVTNLQAGQREEQQRREAARRLGAIRGQIAQSGTGLGGSNADIYGQSARDAELDALNIRYAGLMESKGLLNQASAQRTNAQGLIMEGKQAKQAGYMRAGTQLVSGGSTLKFNKNPQTGFGPGVI
jgi:hypothetical protein